jgi:hypothetical protein
VIGGLGWLADPAVDDLGRFLLEPFLYHVGKDGSLVIFSVFDEQLAFDLFVVFELLPVHDGSGTYLSVSHPKQSPVSAFPVAVDSHLDVRDLSFGLHDTDRGSDADLASKHQALSLSFHTYFLFHR